MNKWDSTIGIEDSGNARVVLFVSRNKDNKNIPDFKERRKSFLTTLQISDFDDDFEDFVNQGVPGEVSRFYISVNTRDMAKVKKALIHKLIDSQTNTEILHPDATIASIAAQSEYALTHKWLLDVDTKDKSVYHGVLQFINKSDAFMKLLTETPNGYHIIVDHSFDTRKLLDTYPMVTLKRDDLWLVNWMEKEYDF